MMEDWQQRVVDECRALDERIEKLEAFLGSGAFDKLELVDRTLLIQQHHAMSLYLRVLNSRIERFS